MGLVEDLFGIVSRAQRTLLRLGLAFVVAFVSLSALPLLRPSSFLDPGALSWFSESAAAGVLRWSEAYLLPAGEKVIVLGPWDAWTVEMEVGAGLALLLVVPYASALAFRSLWPGMRPHERRAVLLVLPLSAALFAAGMLIALLVLPWLYGFAFALQGPLGASGTVSLSAYITETLLFVLSLGLAFETPVLTYGLGWLGILTTRLMRANMKWAFLACTIAALFVSPGVGGGVIEIPLAFGLFGLYLLGYAMVRGVERSRASPREPSKEVTAHGADQ